MINKFFISLTISYIVVFQLNAQKYEICQKDSLFGVCDIAGKVIIPKAYRAVYPCYNYPEWFIVELKNKFGVIDSKNVTLLPVEYECDMKYTNPFVIDGNQAYFDSTSLIILKKQGKFGLIDAKLKIQIPFEYDFLGYFNYYSASSFIAKKGKNYFLIDKSQKQLSKTDYLDFASFYTFSLYPQVYAILMNNEKKWLFVDEFGKEYNKALGKSEFGNDTIAELIQPVRYNGKFAAFSYDGKLIAQRFDELSRFVPVYPDNSMLYSVFGKNGKYGILRSDGTEVVKGIYSEIDPVYITGQVCKVGLNGKTGIVDLNKGKEVVATLYEDIWVFGWLRGVTYAKKNGKCALLNNQGKLLTDFVFDEIQIYQDDFYGAKKGEKWGYIDLTGKTVIPFEYDNTQGFFNEDILPLSKNGKFGYINKKGQSITEFKFESAERFFNNSKAKVTIDGKNGWIDKQGHETWD
jgi:hypothetical protein